MPQLSEAFCQAYQAPLPRGRGLTAITDLPCCCSRLLCLSSAEAELKLCRHGTDKALFAGRADFPWQRTAITHWESGPIDLTPQNNAWKLATHTFKGYPAGVRRALIVLRGKDEPFWAGWYGAKFAAPELHFGGSRWSDGAEPLKGNT